jgi:hypothetical protein
MSRNSQRLRVRRLQLFSAHVLGARVEPGDRPITLPELDIVIVDQPPGGFDGGLVINAIQLNHANGPVVQSNDKCTINRHVSLRTSRMTRWRFDARRRRMLAREDERESI